MVARQKGVEAIDPQTSKDDKMAKLAKVSEEKVNQMFQSLEQYGVKHGDAFARNITYDNKQGCFCVIDFEFATILETGEGLTIEEAEAEMKKDKYNL